MESQMQETTSYFHPFKYEINGLMRDFLNSNRKLSSDKWKIIYFCIGYIKGSDYYNYLQPGDIVR